MQNVFINQFLNSLAFALINSLWQMAFLWISYQTFIAVFKITSKSKYIILTTLQLLGCSWFVFTFFKAIVNERIVDFTGFILINSIQNTEFISKFFPLLSVIYLFFVLVFLIKFVIQFYHTNHQAKSYQNYTSIQWNEFVNEVATKLHISKRIVLKTTTNNVVPFTIGFLKPIIIVSIAAINNLSAQQLEAILIHELAHIKRQDYIINILLLIIETIMCFNPFSKLFNKEIFAERELCCDDFVINYPFETSQYAQALLNIAKTQTNPQIYATSLGAFETKQHLLYRVNRMFYGENFNSSKKNFSLQFLLTLFFGLSLFGLIGMINSNVKAVIVEADKSSTASKIQFQSIAFKHQNNVVTQGEYFAVNKETKSGKTLGNNNYEVREKSNKTLNFKRSFIQQGFTDLANAIENKNDYTVVKNSENSELVDSSINIDDIAITQAVNKLNNIVVEKFFVPATSQAAASIIIVTTTKKEDGSKQVKIEIEKGSSKVE